MKTFKLYAVFMALFLLFALPACHKDDDKAEPTAEKMIVGKWYLTNIDTGTPSEALTDCEKKTFFQFNDDGTLYAENHFMDAGECTYNSGGGSYSITTDRKYIIINSEESTTQSEIKKLTTTNLVMYVIPTEQTLYFEKR